MRKQLSTALAHLAKTDKRFVFITGDLGFMAFEELEPLLGNRFLNAGISEQNMVSVAASLAYDGFIPFLYSIAPFVVSRPFEQIRNEAGLHNLPVKIIANGGGYGYGIMGSTHHCLEDIALMRSVMHMQLFIPTFNEDVEEAVAAMVNNPHPNYLRLNNTDSRPAQVKPFEAFRQLSTGKKATLIGAGPVVLNAVKLNEQHNLGLNIWTIGQLPLGELPVDLIQQINETGNLITLEEHNLPGGISEMISHLVLKNTEIKKQHLVFNTLCAKGYPSGNYGDQNWHQEENKLAGEPLLLALNQFLQNKNGSR